MLKLYTFFVSGTDEKCITCEKSTFIHFSQFIHFSLYQLSYDQKVSSEFEPPHDKTNKMACAPSENSDQPGHPPCLLRDIAVRMKNA